MSDESLDDLLRHPLPPRGNEEFLARVMAQIPTGLKQGKFGLNFAFFTTCGAIAYFVPASTFERSADRLTNFLSQSLEGWLTFAVVVLFWPLLVELIRK